MRYEVYYWSSDDMDDYFKDFGEEFDDDTLRPNLYGCIIQYGECKLKTDNKEEALEKCAKIQDEDYYGICSIWDTQEHDWFN